MSDNLNKNNSNNTDTQKRTENSDNTVILEERSQPKSLPAGRLSRLGKFASLATKVAGNVISEGSKQWVKGEKPQAKSLLLTPKNIQQVTDQLADLRGAAMKLGQMLSMDAGDFLTPELADIMAKLRSNASPMPSKQFNQAMIEYLGEDWKLKFTAFNFHPIASASIGQVHLAYDDAGNKLAVKVQYPGVRKSIDSDVDNVATLLKIIGIFPEGVDYKGLLNEAKQQLHDEANYEREARYLTIYHQALASSPEFIVPKFYPECSSNTVLAMEFVEGQPIESIAHLPQEEKDRVMTALIDLLFKELFELNMVQTDPNFANYLYQEESKKIVLLDFGASREYLSHFSSGYKKLFSAVKNNQQEEVNQALEQIGFFSQDIAQEQRQSIIDLVQLACEPMMSEGRYDFGATDLAQRLRQAGQILSFEQDYWHTPPAPAIFLHRKIAGMYLLAARLGCKVPVAAILEPYLVDVEINN